MVAVAEAAKPRPRLSRSPIAAYLNDLLERIRPIRDGDVASYIPELAKANPEGFAIAIATVDGEVYAVGDAERQFSIQSISKPFVYGAALALLGREKVLEHVGVEPTGEAFNSIVLDEKHNRPFNPMVNAGAIATAELIPGKDTAECIANMKAIFARFLGRPVEVDADVLRSETDTGHRNRAIAYMMLNSGMVKREPEDILAVYFSQCSVLVSCSDLAVMAATLANAGINPLTNEAAIPADCAADVLTVMNMCGMYNYAGQWSYEVGMPAKSGVSGGVIAVIPGQLGIGVFSPRLDATGNSVRGIATCKAISEDFSLHVFRNQPHVGNVVRRELHGDVIRSKRLRSADERRLLDREGKRIAVIEVQGALFFGSTERLMRHIQDSAAHSDLIVLDLRRVTGADHAASRLLTQLTRTLADEGRRLRFAHIESDGPFAELHAALLTFPGGENLIFEHRDSALEQCENEVIAASQGAHGASKYNLGDLAIFRGLARADLKALESVVMPMVFEAEQVIVREGDPANLFFIVTKGTVTVRLRVGEGEEERVIRLATLGPGLSFGEMALLDGGRRSADVVADERVVCYGFSVESLNELSEHNPKLMITILGNMMRDFSERLRRANDEIRVLEQ